ncbi:hypothetical protein WL32_28150 [Burkholderia cepacia]|nr:hypothetical protein WL32_28150 [Burkholderia cepacia]
MDDGIDADATQAYNKALEVRDYMRADVLTGNAAALTDSCTPGTKGHKGFIAYVQRLGQFQQQDNGSIHPKCAQQIRMMSGAKPGNF